MGLLDDAIREHLELRRRHGADPSEVARQEQEALGPPRRGAAQPDDGELSDSGAVSLETLEDDERPVEPYDDEPEVDDEPPASTPAGEPEAPVAPPAPPEDRGEPDARVAEPEPAAGEDVLEETPEFLQETPEHDRLWFEQKPPRDFEF
jgi:hypothetical protein